MKNTFNELSSRPAMAKERIREPGNIWREAFPSEMQR